MSELFKIVPPDLFRPLASPGAPVYARVLFALFAATRRHHQPLSREMAVNLTSEILSDPEALTATSDAEEADGQAGESADRSESDEIEDEAGRILSRSGKVLRALARYGWLRVETQSDFTQVYILPDYAFRLLETLELIALNNPPPLRGLIYSIYCILQDAVRRGNEHIGLPEAGRQTLLLLNGLKELQHNIGAHIEQALRRLQAREVLEQFFTTYRQEVVDRAYHQLRTTDHVSRFRPEAMQALDHLSGEAKLAAIAHRLRAGGEAASFDDAESQLREQLRTMRECFEGLDETLEAIDARHSQFVNAAVRAVELQLNAASTTSGQLNAIISHLLGNQKDRHRDERDAANQPPPESYEKLVSLFELALLDGQSLAAPSRAASPFVPETPAAPALSDEDIARAQRMTLRQLNSAISRERVRRFAAELLRDREEARGGDIHLASPDSLPLLIYLRHYGNGSLGYEVRELPGADWIERDGVGFRDFILRKKESGQD
ncbi:MAG: Wadjet anti-phage system protein JetA family protein [Blastocatellales bacterium]